MLSAIFFETNSDDVQNMQKKKKKVNAHVDTWAVRRT